jgi:hypothetical protein
VAYRLPSLSLERPGDPPRRVCFAPEASIIGRPSALAEVREWKFRRRAQRGCGDTPGHFPQPVQVSPAAGCLPQWSKKMSDQLCDSLILPNIQNAADFTTNVLHASTEHSIMGKRKVAP